jgi:cytochrome c oxidase subunit 2
MKLRLLAPTVILALAIPALAAAGHSAAQDAPHRITITAKRFAFSPDEISVKKGEPVTIALTSEDFSHGIKFADLDVVLYGAKGETKEVTFTPTKAGYFVGQCSTFCGAGHGGMKLTMHVTE